MKKSVILIYVVLSLFAGKSTYAQGCLPEGITFGGQYKIDHFRENYPQCTKIIGDVFIGAPGNFTADITSLEGLQGIKAIGGNLKISNILGLTSFIGLDSLVSIGGDLYITNVRDLYSFTGLNNLQSIGKRLVLWSNDELDNIYALRSLDTIGTDLYLFANWRITDLSGLNNLMFIGGDLKLDFNWRLNSIAHLSKLNYIGGSLIIDLNYNLTSLEGLENVSFLGENLNIRSSEGLVDLKELNRLTSIGGSIEIVGNENLESLAGLRNVVTIGGDLKIGIPTFEGPIGNISLNSLAALEKLTQMNGDLYIFGNSSLASLAGLDNIDKSGINDLAIIGNPLLSFCEVKSICDYLTVDVNSYYFAENAQGCTTYEQVSTACKASAAPEFTGIESFNLFPNPANDKVMIKAPVGESIQEVIIFNNIGGKVFHYPSPTSQIDISTLPAGLYILELISFHSKARLKLIVN